MDKGKAILNPVEAARIIGVTPQLIRQNMKDGVWSFGEVVKPKTKNGNYRFYIHRARLMEWLEKGE